MNKRIEELAKQANYDTALYGGKPGDRDFDELYNQKFADLIVRECCEVINKDCNLQFNEGVITNLGGLNQARELIKQHFGVE